MKNSSSTFKNRTISIDVAEGEDNKKSTNINVLLNRVRIDQKKRKKKKDIFFCISFFSTDIIWNNNILINLHS